MGTKNSSFQFHFILIYALAALISLGIIVSSLVLSNRLTGRYHRYATVTEPLKYQIQAFNIDVNKQSALFQTYLLTGEEAAQKDAIFLLFKKLPSRIELIQEFSSQLEDPSLQLKIEELEANLMQLQSVSKQLSHSSAAQSAQLIQETFSPDVKAVSALLKNLNAYLYEKHSDSFSKTIATIEDGQYWILSLFLLLMGAFYGLVRKTRHFIIGRIKELELQIRKIAQGDLPEELPVPANELNTIVESVNSLLRNLKNVKDFSLQVGKGDFDTNISVFDEQGALGNALAEMRNSLKMVSAEDKQRNWVNHGLAQFHSLIREHNQNLQDLCYSVLSQLIKYVNANQGGVFILQEGENQHKSLKLEASYAYNRKKFQEKVLEPGQGLAGQAYLEKEAIYLKEIPSNYVSITSGLGEATPRTLLVQPLLVNEKVIGVMELAAFQDFPAYVRDFIEKVGESLAAAVSTAQTNEYNSRILLETQELSEQMRAQEEELRQNTEELQATQEEMERLIRELQAENQALKESITRNA